VIDQLALALEAIDRNATDDLSRAKCRGLVRGYHARWQTAGYVPIAVEQMLTADLRNPETDRTSRTFITAGKLDVQVTLDGKTLLMDHKTSSMDIADPDSPYWRQLAIEGQVSHYMLLGWQNGIKFDGAIWDVVRKPSILPKKLTKAERTAIAATGTYFGSDVSIESRNSVQTEERETPELYEHRLAHDCTTERPNWYFQRRQVPRMDHELLEYAEELWLHGQELIHTRATGRHVRNSGACMLYGSACKFLGICSGYDQPDSDKWQRKPNVHSELPELEGDGKDVLTNSRIRTYQTCKRKHELQYEIGIERYDEEEKEALVFGSLYHLALNAWWTALLPEGNSNGTGNSVSPIGGEHATASQATIAG
jgi:hypothetical protein